MSPSIEVAGIVAVYADQPEQPDFSSQSWLDFAHHVYNYHDIHVQHLSQGNYADYLIDPEFDNPLDGCLFSGIRLGLKAVLALGFQTQDVKDINLEDGGWISDCTIPPFDWQSPGRGEDAYWFLHGDYTIGITAIDIGEGSKYIP